jgi:hypothetical protein
LQFHADSGVSSITVSPSAASTSSESFGFFAVTEEEEDGKKKKVGSDAGKASPLIEEDKER